MCIRDSREAEQAGYMTKAQIIAYSGGDYDDNINELAREQELAAEAGVKLDKDLDLTDETVQLDLLESVEPTRKRGNGKRKRS